MEPDARPDCPLCGKTCRMRYPGGDPENGPARYSCLDDHADVLDYRAEVPRGQRMAKRRRREMRRMGW